MFLAPDWSLTEFRFWCRKWQYTMVSVTFVFGWKWLRVFVLVFSGISERKHKNSVYSSNGSWPVQTSCQIVYKRRLIGEWASVKRLKYEIDICHQRNLLQSRHPVQKRMAYVTCLLALPRVTAMPVARAVSLVHTICAHGHCLRMKWLVETRLKLWQWPAGQATLHTKTDISLILMNCMVTDKNWNITEQWRISMYTVLVLLY